MSAIEITPPFPVYFDETGKALESGYIYIGTANLEPIANPIPVYWDVALAVPASQPIRTINGYPSRAGSPASIYANSDYSLTVKDKHGRLIYTSPTNTDPSDTLRGDLANTSDPTLGDALIGVKRTATGAVATTLHTYIEGQVFNVKTDFGATGDGTTNDRDAIQAAITAAGNGVLYFPYGTYRVNTALNLVSNITLWFAKGAKLLLGTAVTTEYVLRGSTVSNVVFRDMTVEGNGLSGVSAIYLTSCTNVTFDNCKITKAGTIGLWCVSCSFVKVYKSELSNNYNYGVEFRDCDGCEAVGNRCNANGDTGVATSTGGRGIMLWRSRSCYIAGNRCTSNTEYGFRIYSEAADATYSYGNVISGNYFEDNTNGDFVLYDESQTGSKVFRNVISDNIAVRSVNTTSLGTCFLLHGGQNTFVNNHAYKTGTIGTDAAFNFYYAFDCKMIGCTATNFAQAFSLPGSERITIEGCAGITVANAVTAMVKDITVKNCRFVHGGVGAADVAIQNYAATGKNYYEGNTLDGFHTGFYIAAEAVALFRNTTLNSGFAGLRVSGTSIAGLECGDNVWDSTAPWELSALRKNTSTYHKATTYYNAAPSSLTWAVGDRVYQYQPVAGQPKSWVCTVAGTPGTWVSEGNL